MATAAPLGVLPLEPPSTETVDTTKALTYYAFDFTPKGLKTSARFIVADDLYEPFVDKFTAAVLASTVAPLSSLAAAERIEAQVARAIFAAIEKRPLAISVPARAAHLGRRGCGPCGR